MMDAYGKQWGFKHRAENIIEFSLNLLTICTVQRWDLANTLERMRPTAQPQSREYYRVLIEPPLFFMCTVQGWDVANTLERKPHDL
jgi:hypothetical protein